MSKTIAISQSNYIPWRGYFDMMRKVDLFIIGDNVQYTKQDWRNRNRIKAPNGPIWLTIPVHSLGRISARRRIDEIRVADPAWCDTHLKVISRCYNRAPYFDEVASWLFPLLEEAARERLLSRINEHILRGIALGLGIRMELCRTGDISAKHEKLTYEDPTIRVLDLCQAAGADRYLTGPAAKAYLNKELLLQHGIDVEWMDYSRYPEYQQLWGPFVPDVSIVDLLFNMGPQSTEYLGAPSVQTNVLEQ
jgi:hypothetical protein